MISQIGIDLSKKICEVVRREIIETTKLMALEVEDQEQYRADALFAALSAVASITPLVGALVFLRTEDPRLRAPVFVSLVCGLWILRSGEGSQDLDTAIAEAVVIYDKLPELEQRNVEAMRENGIT